MEPVVHSFDLERKRSRTGVSTAFALGYHYARALFSTDNPPRTIHLEGQHNNGKSAFAKGMAVAFTRQREPETVHELSGHFNWQSGATEDGAARHNVTIIDASKLKHPFSQQVFNHVDRYALPENQTLVIEHASMLEDDLFAAGSPVKDRALTPDIRIDIGDIDEANRQRITIEILNPATIKPDGFAEFQQHVLSKAQWCTPARQP